MNASELLKLISRQPFEPFELRMTTGECLVVERPSQIATSLNSESCTVYESAGGARIVALESIVGVLPVEQSPSAERQHQWVIGFLGCCWILVVCMLPQILYMTGVTPTGPLLELNFIPTVAIAVVIAVVGYFVITRKLCK